MRGETMIAVVGGSEERGPPAESAREVGRLLARKGAVIVCGGLGGIMEAVAEGACQEGGTVIGILPGPRRSDANAFVTYAIATNLGEARNVILAQTCDAVIAIGGEAGTLSEISLAVKMGKPVVILTGWERLKQWSSRIHFANSAEHAVHLALSLARSI
ncbi:MAG: TIGR00725 family protein [bacterium JZ-2024 1]